MVIRSYLFEIKARDNLIINMRLICVKFSRPAGRSALTGKGKRELVIRKGSG